MQGNKRIEDRAHRKDPLYDEKMTQEGYKVVRYADDIIVLCRSRTPYVSSSE